uniref:Uncharacterized protein n=1 Tax=Rhizophora mucronata TaxID=61149 RepID=A0A2P2PJL3_RHIMU
MFLTVVVERMLVIIPIHLNKAINIKSLFFLYNFCWQTISSMILEWKGTFMKRGHGYNLIHRKTRIELHFGIMHFPVKL